MFVNKYKPLSVPFSSLKRFVIKKELPNLLFHGIAGCGKTSSIHLISNLIYEDHKDEMVLEINGSEDRGVNVFKTTIKSFCETFNFSCNLKKLVIIDEADSLTPESQELLQYFIKKYKKVSFCIICNFLNNISMMIQSLCTCYNFKPVSKDRFNGILKRICTKEKIRLSTEFIGKIYHIFDRDLRKGINLLQIIKFNDCKNIYHFLNFPSELVLNKITSILCGDEKIVMKYKKINSIIMDNNLDLKILISNLLKHIIFQKIFDEKKIQQIVLKMGEIEYNVSKDYTYNIQLLSLISVF